MYSRVEELEKEVESMKRCFDGFMNLLERQKAAFGDKVELEFAKHKTVIQELVEGAKKEFYTLQGKCERIKNFPFPRQYASVNLFFVWIFIVLLPFAMLNIVSGMDNPVFVWLTIPLTVLVSWVFIMMELIGDFSENPFEGLYNDVPISTLANGIEIDIRQMLEETDLPEPRPMTKIYGQDLMF